VDILRMSILYRSKADIERDKALAWEKKEKEKHEALWGWKEDGRKMKERLDKQFSRVEGIIGPHQHKKAMVHLLDKFSHRARHNNNQVSLLYTTYPNSPTSTFTHTHPHPPTPTPAPTPTSVHNGTSVPVHRLHHQHFPNSSALISSAVPWACGFCAPLSTIRPEGRCSPKVR
jgi:hypothetical protein